MDKNNDSLYILLGIGRDATLDEIEESYKKLTNEYELQTNPDAIARYQEIILAYEVLSDPEKRQSYDQYGITGLQDDYIDESRMSTENLFSRFFSFELNNNVQVALSLTLEDIYNGNMYKTVQYICTEICHDCNGGGGNTAKEQPCEVCAGGFNLGIEIALPGCCQLCHGRGRYISEEHKCVTCAGKGFIEKEKIVNILIEKGMYHMEKIVFRSQGHQNQNGDRGHLIVVLKEKPHPVFRRQCTKLLLFNVKIGLSQALCGLEYSLTHLDGRKLIIRTQPGQVIMPSVNMVIKGEGMPLRKDPSQRGDLFISFNVEMPENNFASLEDLAKLEEILPPRIQLEAPKSDIVQVDLFEDLRPNEHFKALGEASE